MPARNCVWEARRARVAVGVSGDELWLEVADDGRGFEPARASTGMGTKVMRERTLALGGNLEIKSRPDEGTTVLFEPALEADEEEPQEPRILLVEDHVSFRQAAASVLEREPGFAVVGQAGSLRGAPDARRAGRGRNGSGAPGRLRWGLHQGAARRQPGRDGTSPDRQPRPCRDGPAVESGAAGVLHKSIDMNEVVDTLRRLRSGETLLALEEVMEPLRFASFHREQEYEARQAIARLTAREREVLQALADGLDGREIAERLGISIPTERNHVSSTLTKLGLHSQLRALVFALRHDVVQIR